MNGNNRTNSLKNILTNGFYTTTLWGISFALYEWILHFSKSSSSEAYLSVVLIFNLVLFITIWMVTGVGIYIYLSFRKNGISESGVSYACLILFITLFVAIKLYFYSRTLILTHNPFISGSIFAFIVALLITVESLSLHYLRKKLKKPLVAHFAINRWAKYLTFIMFALISIYILQPKYEDLFHTTGVSNIGSKPNIILLTLDTLRADHLSCYGYERKTSPFIDQIADEGILFEECIANSSWTLPSHASIFTSLYPSDHGTVYSGFSENKISKLPDELTTLAEILKEAGYKTAGFVGGPFVASDFGMNQGFDYYNDRLFPMGKVYFDKLIFLDLFLHMFDKQINRDKLSSCFEYCLIHIWNLIYNENFTDDSIGHSSRKKKADEINAVALPWIERHKDSRFFLFINYFDPHARYTLPQGFKNRYNTGYKGKLRGLVSELKRIHYHQYVPTEDDLNYLISLYDSQINFLDLHIKQLFDTLVSCGIEDKTILVITSDHGEAFGEHGFLEHGFTLYEDQIKVPLILWGIENFPSPQRISVQVQLIDIMPTVLDLLSMPPAKNIRGKSLIPLSLGENISEEPYALAEIFEDKIWYIFGGIFKRDLKCLRTRQWKYITSSNGKDELYNLIEDNKEMVNVIDFEEDIAKKMKSIIQKTISPSKRKLYDKVKSFQVDSNIKEQLRGLGYID